MSDGGRLGDEGSGASGAGGPIHERVGYVIRVAAAAIWQDLTATFAPFDIRPQQFAAMSVIAANADCHQELIARTLGIKVPNMVALIEELVQRGLVLRTISPADRRVRVLSLTPAGEALMAALGEADRAHVARVEDAIGAGNVPRLLADLHALARLRETIDPLKAS